MSIINNSKSYTNKDFQSIYNELLDLVEQLTDKWNPTSEVDPGVVLVKLMAVLGDKLNYSIDKQILELFPSTVTQRKNARQIFNLIGYKMKWYMSAIDRVGIKLKELHNEDIIIPAFTILTNKEKSTNYITLGELRLNANDLDTVAYVDCIEGRLLEVKIGDNTEIDLSDLDENYRIYFSDLNVAENGIFVSDGGTNIYDWKQVDNINAHPLGSKVYEFNVSEDETRCYLQFPTDINDLTVSKSINIKYITSAGAGGNIIQSTLRTFNDHILDTLGEPVENKLAIIQTQPINNGANPETIDDAYTNSRKTVSTFDTLITKLDYYNYIRRLENRGRKLVSNLVVADREDDLNDVIDIITIKNGLEVLEHENKEMTPYDLRLYMLDTGTTYEDGFKPIFNPTRKLEVEHFLTEAKAINLDFHLPPIGEDKLYLFKGKFTLAGQIITSEKLSKDEARVLENKIVLGLQQKYSSSNLEFGEELDYTEIVTTIMSFDNRIKTVALSQPEYTIYKATVNDEEIEETELTNDEKYDLIAKMIARGNLAYYKFDDSFKHQFGVVANIYKDINSIKTEFNLNLNSTEGPVSLTRGEVITLYAPQYVVDTQYGAGCSIYYTSNTIEELEPNKYYVVGIDDIDLIEIHFRDNDNNNIKNTLSPGTVFMVTFADVKTGATKPIQGSSTFTTYKLNQYNLTRGQRIDNVFINESIILSENEEYVLGVNEYLIYTDNITAEKIKLGSGIKIKNNNNTPISLANNYDSIKDKWKDPLTLNTSLTVINQDIHIISEGCLIEALSDNGIVEFELSNTPYTLKDNESVKIVDAVNGERVIDTNYGRDKYTLVTRFDFVYTGEPIKLHDEVGRQEVVLTFNDNNTYAITENFIELNKSTIIIGGIDVNVSKEDLKLRAFNYTEINVEKDVSGFYKVENSIDLPFKFKEDDHYLLPLIVEGLEADKELTLTIDSTKQPDVEGTTEYKNGDYLIDLKIMSDSNKLTIQTNQATGCKIKFGDITKVSGFNEDEIWGSSSGLNKENLADRINNLCSNTFFNYAHRVNPLDKCAKPLEPANWFDPNHIYNKYIICQYEYPQSSDEKTIVVNRYSIKD